MLTFEQFKITQAKIQRRLEATGAKLQTYPHGPMGLTPDDVKNSEQYKADKSAYALAFAQLRQLNGTYIKIYAKELAADRKKRRAGMNGYQPCY